MPFHASFVFFVLGKLIQIQHMARLFQRYDMKEMLLNGHEM